jgi:hypothetical protein
MPEVGPSVLLKGDRFIVAKRGAPAEDLPRAGTESQPELPWADQTCKA